MKFLKDLKNKYGFANFGFSHNLKIDTGKPTTKNHLSAKQNANEFVIAALCTEKVIKKLMVHIKQIKQRNCEQILRFRKHNCLQNCKQGFLQWSFTGYDS